MHFRSLRGILVAWHSGTKPFSIACGKLDAIMKSHEFKRAEWPIPVHPGG
ncbi:hypothetical protein [Polaromonas sp. CG9_12]|nr:hypothetical protein [Polaromonas sp. CG9_12]